MSKEKTHQDFFDARDALFITVETLKAAGVGRLGMAAALAHHLNNVINSCSDDDDIAYMRALYANALIIGKC